jgi:hypothetical protein
MIRSAFLGLAALVLTACSSTAVPLTSRPTDLGSARDLARAVADAGHCGDLEDLGQGTGYWEFTCQDRSRSFTITTADRPEARLARTSALSGSGAPLKAGDWFLVQEDADHGGSKDGAPSPTPVSDLDRFPGTVVRLAG